jgi:ethanolamine utilization protein EutQ (cupin superfamily)
MNHKNHKICPLLWKHLCINTDGGLSPCCEISQFQTVDLEKDLQSLYNTKEFQTMRSAMLSNQSNSYCEKICYSKEKQGIKSKRLAEIEKYEKHLPSVFSDSKQTEVSLSEIVDIDIKPSNYCNSRCVMCNNNRSSQYANESKLHNAYKGPVLVGGWYESYRKQLEQLYPDLYSLKINGGETTVMPEFPLVLESIKGNNELRLSLNINNTIDITKYIDIFSTLKRVDIDCSIEGYGSNNEYIRYPANWATVYNNLKKINKLVANYKNINASFCMTIMSLNYVSWPNDFYQLTTEFDNFEKKPFVYFITQPESLLIQGLPQQMLDKGYQNVLDLKAKLLELDNDIVETYKHYAEKGQDNLVTKKLISYTTYIDNARNINIKNYIPEIENALS